MTTNTDEGRAFTFSVVMAVYNTAPYLSDAVRSLLNQSIGFLQHIQLIMVNDGSTDNSGEICRRYQEWYPENVIYIEKENGGVSSARNEGLKYVRGRYVNFMDSDDVWGEEAFRQAKVFFDAHPDTGIGTGRMVYYGNKKTTHHLDYMFKETKVVDIHDEHTCPVLSAAKTFISSELLKDRSFDETVQIAEDVLFLNRIVMDHGRFGVIRNTRYYYRKRTDKTSALDGSVQNPSYYLDTPQTVYFGLIEESIRRFGSVIPYIQYLLITDLQWRLSKPVPGGVLTAEQDTAYQQMLRRCLQHIDDAVILEQRRMSFAYKAYALRLKYNNAPDIIPEDTKHLQADRIQLNAEILYAEKDMLVIEGKAEEKYIGDEFTVIAQDEKGNVYPMSYRSYPLYDSSGINAAVIAEGYEHTVRLPAGDHIRYSFYLVDQRGYSRRIKIKHGRFSRLTGFNDSFFREGNYIYKLKKHRISIYSYRLKTFLASMRRYHQEIRKTAPSGVMEIRREAIRRKLLSGKPIWIISDRTHLAEDSGATLFEYLMKSDAGKHADIYFLLEENSPDFERMSSIGKVLRFGSTEHLIKQAAAELIISSHADGRETNPYGLDLKYYRDLLGFRYVFLQHGIIKDDLSGWLQKYKKNINIFITSARPEYESIINGKYGYDASVVKLTGLGRYDKLEDRRKKVIAIIPSWRANLAGKGTAASSRRPYSRNFINSEYYAFYQRLISDERILSAMRERGYTGYLYLHTLLREQARDFKGNEVIEVWKEPVNYSRVFNESALLVTDFSSVAFDFAYLKKPVIYAQFDKESFFKSHTYKEGYFDYEKDGFGPVCYDYESAVALIVKAIQEDCIMKDEYLKRVDGFFEFNDHNNCARVYQEIKKIGSM